MNNSFTDFQKRIEHMLLFQLTLNIKNGKLLPKDAQKISQDYLKITAQTKEELLQGLITIGHTYSVVNPVIAKFSSEYDEEFTKNVLSQIHDKIKKGDIESAAAISKQGGAVHA